ncbi:MAG: MBL fold metallo-hydrolase [Clostridia bacterium]|nr:MBL fold metallo-hydrolase [Clostridia bacterium]
MSEKRNKLSAVLLIFVFFILLFSACDLDSEVPDDDSSVFDNPLVIAFLDVDQGDCGLISCNGKNILIDCGEAEYSSRVIEFLDENNIQKLDCFILSHPHSDHMGAAQRIVGAVDCETIVLPEFSEFSMPVSNLYYDFLDSLESLDCNVISVNDGDSFDCGDVRLDFFSPLFDSEDYNDMSIVLNATYSETSVLFTGDATVRTENAILEKDYDIETDILKVAHHGSYTSSSLEFLQKADAEIAVISCGLNNLYGHPHDEVVDRLKDLGVKIFRTDESGTIVCYGDGKTFEVANYNDL